MNITAEDFLINFKIPSNIIEKLINDCVDLEFFNFQDNTGFNVLTYMINHIENKKLSFDLCDKLMNKFRYLRNLKSDIIIKKINITSTLKFYFKNKSYTKIEMIIKYFELYNDIIFIDWSIIGSFAIYEGMNSVIFNFVFNNWIVKFDPNDTNYFYDYHLQNRTLLMHAIFCKIPYQYIIDIYDLTYSQSNLLDAKDINDCTTLMYFAREPKISKLLLPRIIHQYDNDRRSDIDIVDNNGKSALYYYIEAGDLTHLNLFKSCGCDILRRSNGEYCRKTPLMAYIDKITYAQPNSNSNTHDQKTSCHPKEEEKLFQQRIENDLIEIYKYSNYCNRNFKIFDSNGNNALILLFRKENLHNLDNIINYLFWKSNSICNCKSCKYVNANENEIENKNKNDQLDHTLGLNMRYHDDPNKTILYYAITYNYDEIASFLISKIIQTRDDHFIRSYDDFNYDRHYEPSFFDKTYFRTCFKTIQRFENEKTNYLLINQIVDLPSFDDPDYIMGELYFLFNSRYYNNITTIDIYVPEYKLLCEKLIKKSTHFNNFLVKFKELSNLQSSPLSNSRLNDDNDKNFESILSQCKENSAIASNSICLNHLLMNGCNLFFQGGNFISELFKNVDLSIHNNNYESVLNLMLSNMKDRKILFQKFDFTFNNYTYSFHPDNNNKSEDITFIEYIFSTEYIEIVTLGKVKTDQNKIKSWDQKYIIQILTFYVENMAVEFLNNMNLKHLYNFISESHKEMNQKWRKYLTDYNCSSVKEQEKLINYIGVDIYKILRRKYISILHSILYDDDNNELKSSFLLCDLGEVKLFHLIVEYII